MSDWENLVDYVASDKEITEEDLRMMEDLEKEMILDGLWTEGYLLGEDFMVVDHEEHAELPIDDES